MLPRRSVLAAAALALPGPALAADRFAALEARAGGRLGVAAYSGPRRIAAWRANERFPMCSTFKAPLAAAILARVDAGKETLDRRIVFGPEDLRPHAPATGPRVGPPGMTVGELCEAAVTLSDNPAANLLLRTLGGPEGFTAWLRRTGDRVTRLDRWETELNSAVPGDLRDTTTPAAMARTVQRLVLAGPLTAASRQRLKAWLIASQTGAQRLRGGLPAGWTVGDKTGAGENGTTNDVAIVWPPARAPLVVSAYLTGSALKSGERAEIFAEIARIVTA